MTSWRDDTPEDAQADLDGLLEEAMGFAIAQLEKRGAFLPFGSRVAADGERKAFMVDPESTDAELHLRGLASILVKQRGELRAAVRVSDRHVPELEGDAIHFAADHSCGTSLVVMAPYSLSGEGPHVVELGTLRAERGEAEIWGA